jgi:hypothetical protein
MADVPDDEIRRVQEERKKREQDLAAMSLEKSSFDQDLYGGRADGYVDSIAANEGEDEEGDTEREVAK